MQSVVIVWVDIVSSHSEWSIWVVIMNDISIDATTRESNKERNKQTGYREYRELYVV